MEDSDDLRDEDTGAAMARRLSTLKEAPEPMTLMDGRGTGKTMSMPLICTNVHAAAAARQHGVDNASCPCNTRVAILAGAGAAHESSARRGGEPQEKRRAGDGEGGEGLGASQLFAKILAVEAQSNVRYRPRGRTVFHLPSTLDGR